MRLTRRHNPRGGVMPIRTGSTPNPRGCPGSMAMVRDDGNGRGVCPFCNADKKIRKDGRLVNHARPTY
jgi:hypothetical protein